MVNVFFNVLNEFKRFALRGSVVDMAVGFVIANEFVTIVSSFVSNVLMPPIGAVTGGIDFSDIVIPLLPAADGPAVAIHIGAFLNALIAFLIATWAVFMLIKGANVLKDREEAKAAPPAKELVLLQEIRDLLARRQA
jgi:large conductance mechanosensitive channel